MTRKSIGKDEIQFSPHSIVDEFGRVFSWNGKIYRAINQDAIEKVEALFASGLIKRLEDLGFIPKSRITDYSLDGYALVIQHETAPVVSYPHEWSFEMLRRAALLVVEINKISISYGYQTSDCHPYNVIFFGEQPKFVDIGSFFLVDKIFKRHLYAYQEFCKCYLFPLKVWAGGDSFTARRYLQRWKLMLLPEAYISYRLGGSNGVIRKIIKKVWEFGFTLQSLTHLLAGASESKRWKKYRWIGEVLFSLRLPLHRSTIIALQRSIEKLRSPTDSSVWGDYHNRVYGPHNGGAISDRFTKLVDIVEALDVHTVTDIGGNQGLFSESLARINNIDRVVCIDSDEIAIDVGFQRLTGNKDISNKVLFGVVNPFYPEINWLEDFPESRFKSELAIALALTHHLVLGQGYSLEYVLSSIKAYSTKYVIVEFMPLGLYSSLTGTGPPVPKWYTQEWFLEEFNRHFILRDVVPVEENRVVVVGENIINEA